MAKMTKNYKKALEAFDRKTVYPIAEATKLIKDTSTTKFDSSVEVSFNLNIDTKKADQQIRGAMVLPAGTGKSQKVLVLTSTKAKEATAAGADFVGADDMIAKIKGGWFGFDVIIATPEMMAKLGPIGRVLGPKGLMPNPKTGTVTMDVAKAIEEVKKGKIEYRADKDGNIQTIIGKVSFSAADLAKNLKAISTEILKQKPMSIKGEFVNGVTLSTTMGPGIKVNVLA